MRVVSSINNIQSKNTFIHDNVGLNEINGRAHTPPLSCDIYLVSPVC